MTNRSQLEAANISRVMRDGPSLGQAWKNNVWIEARDRRSGYVLLGGLGSFGIGRGWYKEEAHHQEYPGYGDAPDAVYTGTYFG